MFILHLVENRPFTYINRVEFAIHSKSQVIFFVIFYSVLRPFQDYFSSYETSQPVGGAETGEPREKPPGTPVAPTHTRHSGEMVE